jgi:hypothetical protein
MFPQTEIRCKSQPASIYYHGSARSSRPSCASGARERITSLRREAPLLGSPDPQRDRASRHAVQPRQAEDRQAHRPWRVLRRAYIGPSAEQSQRQGAKGRAQALRRRGPRPLFDRGGQASSGTRSSCCCDTLLLRMCHRSNFSSLEPNKTVQITSTTRSGIPR